MFDDDFSDRFRFTGKEITRLMRDHGITIRSLSGKLGVPMTRVREVRRRGISGHSACCWYETITGDLSPEMRAAYRHRAAS